MATDQTLKRTEKKRSKEEASRDVPVKRRGPEKRSFQMRLSDRHPRLMPSLENEETLEMMCIPLLIKRVCRPRESS